MPVVFLGRIWNPPATINTHPKTFARSAYRIDFVNIQTPLLDFFNTHPNHLWHAFVTGHRVRQWDTENQIRIRLGTIVAVESEGRNGKGKGVTERRSQTGRICSGEHVLDSCPSIHCQSITLRTCCAASCVKFAEDFTNNS